MKENNYEIAPLRCAAVAMTAALVWIWRGEAAPVFHEKSVVIASEVE